MMGECPFIIGKPDDQMRHVARHIDHQKTAECLLAKDGRVEEAWYLPHVLQLYHLTWEGDREWAFDDLRQHEHSHSHGTTHLKTNLCLLAMLRIVWSFSCIFSYLKANAKVAFTSAQVYTAPHPRFGAVGKPPVIRG